MTNQSHTELAALVKASKALLERYRVMGCGDGIEARNVELALAALESPKRVQGEVIEPVGVVMFDMEVGCKLGQLYEDLPIDTLLYIRPFTQSELDAAAARARGLVASLNIEDHPTPPTAPAQDAQGSAAWENSEGWESLAWELCADENGEESCNDLIWEGGPVPEPWGDRWMKYEDEAKRLIALVHKHVPATPSPQAEKQPLSKQEVWKLLPSGVGCFYVREDVLMAIVRSVERAHGIVTKESST